MNGQVSNVVRQWDVAQTSFNAADRLVKLIEACSTDNVQPQALRAAESLGFRMLVSPHRISDAVTALGGNESIRIIKLGLTIGLHNGGVIREIRSSTPLIQFFLVATACKLCMINDDIGNTMFEMISVSGLLAEIPVSPPQLVSLINTFSGHSESIVPINLMHQIATLIDASLCRDCKHLISESFLPLSPRDFAELLIQVFDLITDQNIQQVVLKGRWNGLLIATLFIWLRPDDTELRCAGKSLLGPSMAKLSIVIDLDEEDRNKPWSGNMSWSVKVWRQTTMQISELIRPGADYAYFPRAQSLPLRLTKSYYTTIYGDESRVSVLGALAGAIIFFSARNGHLRDTLDCCSEQHGRSRPCRQARIEDVANKQWMSNLDNITTDYGFDDAIGQLQSDFTAFLECHWTGEEDFRLLVGKMMLELLGDLDDHKLFSDATAIAGDTLCKATVQFSSGQSRFSFSHKVDFVTELLSPRGCDASKYMALAFAASIGGLPSDYPPNSPRLVVHRNGLVAALSALWSPNASQSDALGLSVCVGQLKMDGHAYELLREDLGAYGFQNVPGRLVRFSSDGVENSSLSLGNRESLKLSLQMAIAGNNLEIRSSFQPHSWSDRRQITVSWFDSAMAVALSHHIGPSLRVTEQERQEMVRACGDLGNSVAYASSLTGNWVSVEGEQVRRVVTRLHSQELQFFAAGLHRQLKRHHDSDECSGLFIQHSVEPLVYIGKAAMSGYDCWEVIGD